MQFIDAAQAIKWAEEQASRPGTGSQIGTLLKKGGGEGYMDLALTISCRVSDCDPKLGGLCLKAVWGWRDPERDKFIGERIAERLALLPESKKVSQQKLIALGVVTVKAERALSLYKDAYPERRMAHDIGVSRNQFRTSFTWLELRSQAMETLRRWMDQADYEMTDWLDGLGLLVGGKDGE